MCCRADGLVVMTICAGDGEGDDWLGDDDDDWLDGYGNADAP